MIDKKSSLGSSPINWNISKLGEIGYFIRGVSYKKGDLLPKRENSCISLLRSNNIQTELDLSELQYLNKSSVNDGQITQKGDILFCMSNGSPHLVGKNILLPELENYSFGAFCSIFRKTSESALSEYIAKYLQSGNYTSFITSLSRGAGINNLRGSDLENIEIPLPPLETQKAIVAKLDQIFSELDQTKSEIQKNLDNTDELWKSALNQAFQGDWEMKKLGEIYDITSSKRVFQKDWRTSGVPFYRAREIVKLAENGFVDNELFITEEMYEEYGKKYGLPKENDIMVTGVGTIGICYFVKKTDKFYFKDGNILWFKHNFEGINSRFVEYLFKSELLKSQINNGASTVVATLTIEKAKGLIIPVPPLSEQKKIVEHLDQVSNEVKALKSQYQSQLDNLEELKKSVLDKAFRGELGE